ncbi:MAG TPA: hypothetical protein VKL40_17475 [Candidatus Angelobacter sp.]|nr:hypothetical protein [Candidatus Angelobacter sp.]
MKNVITKWAMVAIALVVGLAVAVAQEPRTSAGIKVNPSEVQKKAGTPPPAGTTKTTAIGTEHLKMTTPPDSQSWMEQLDVDGNGQVNSTTLTWDGKDKILFSTTSGSFTCQNGTTGNGELLVAVNGEGNPNGRPVGSGFWLASLDKGQCGAQAQSFWGCKFDSAGNSTACGTARIDEKTYDLSIVKAAR